MSSLGATSPSIERRFLTLAEVVAIVGASPASIWRWSKIGVFPRRRQIGPRRVGWDRVEVEQWLASREQV